MSHPSPAPQGRVYPRDEFDDLEPVDGRRGAHRARPNPVLAMLPVLLVIVAVVAVVIGAMTMLGGSDPPAPAPAATAGQDQEQSPGDDEAPAPTAAPEGTAGPDADDAPAAAEPQETLAPQPPVDTSVPVTVLNGTRTTGLAGRATQQLRAAGWTVPRADNYRDGETPPTTVYFPGEVLASTAAAVAEDLGGARSELSDAFGDEGLTVVLGEDYQP